MKKSAPVVSIIVPVYKVEKYLRRCLDSISAQTFDKWEAICVNDGSPDGCDKILSEYASRDKRFIVLNKKNGGLSDARNFGMKRARGEYILFVDSDDFIHPQTLELTVTAARDNNADMVSFQYSKSYYRCLKRKQARGNNIDSIMPPEMSRVFDIKNMRQTVTNKILFYATERNHGLRAHRPVQYHCMVWRNLYRRDFISGLEFIKGILFEDFPFYSLVLLRRPRTVILDAELYFYIPNPQSILSTLRAARMMDSIATGVAAAYIAYHQNADIDEFKYFNREFVWPFIITSMRKLAILSNGADRDNVRGHMRMLWNSGVFDFPPNMRARKYRRRIWAFINE